MLTIVDNYDSFVHTLAGYCRALGVETAVVRNDACSVADLRRSQAVMLSPGPGGPQDAGVCIEAARELGNTPLLGICLGHQAIGAAFGARVVRVEPCHGRTSPVIHRGDGLFAGVESPVSLARYHSLCVVDVGLPLRCDAETNDGIVMAISHVERPIWGLQPHPESVQSQLGPRVLANFLRFAGFNVSTRAVAAVESRVARTTGSSGSGGTREPDFFSDPIKPAYPLPTPGSAS